MNHSYTRAWSHHARWLPWFILATALSVTFLLWENERHSADQKLQAEFNSRVRETKISIEHRMLAYTQVLRGLAGLFSHDNNVTRLQFHNYFDRLNLDNNYPGIQGVAFLRIVPLAQKDRHIAAIRKEGYPEYAIKPEGMREIYTPVIYIEPFSGRNLRAFGHDPYSDPIRRSAMERARDTNHATISGKVKLVQETNPNGQAGFMMYLPIYKNGAPHNTLNERRTNLIGWVSAPFRMGDLMSGLLNPESSFIDFEIYDSEVMSANTLMYDSDDNPGSRPGARFQYINLIPIADHIWTLATRSNPSFEERMEDDDPQVTIYTGISASLLLTWLTWLLVSSRARALKAAYEMNRELVDSEKKFRSVFESASDGIFLQDATGFIDCNEKGASMYGLSRAAVIGCSPADLAPEKQPDGRLSADVAAEKITAVLSGEPQQFEWRSLHANGTSFDVEITLNRIELGGSACLQAVVRDITERKRTEVKLQLAANVFTHVHEGIAITDPEGTILDVNETFSIITGYRHDEAVGRNPRILSSGRQGKAFYVAMWRDLVEKGNWSGEIWNRHKNGNEYAEALTISAVRDANGNTQQYVALFSDITGRRKREESLRLAATVFETVDHAVVITDTENKIITVNPAFTSITGYTQDEVIGKNPHLLSSGKHPPEFYQELWGTLTATGSWHGEVWNRRKLGDIYVEQLSIRMVRDEQGQATHHVGTFSDISTRKAAEEKVQHMAHYDLLTDLPNRTLITDRLKQTLIAAKRNKARMALMFLDLDKFKPVNDTLGHATGDLLLKEVAQRLQHCVRESDTVARIGGDEFVILLPIIEGEQDAMVVAEKIQHALAAPFELSGHTINISVSIGIAIYPDHGDDEKILIQNADIAMYHVKRNGHSDIRIYQPNIPQQ